MTIKRLAALVLVFGVSSATAETRPPALFNYTGGGAACQAGAIGPAPSAPVIDRGRKRLEQALIWFGRAIASAKARPANAPRLAAEMQALARAGAFTKLDWSGSGSSPAHWQTNLLKNIAIAVNVVDYRGGWSAGQREAVIAWGDEVYRSSHYSRWGRSQGDRWPDTVAAAAAAYVMWGVAAPNGKALSEGYRDFARVARMLRATGGTGAYFGGGKYARSLPPGWGARIEDKTIGDLVLAAHAARRAGRDLFDTKSGKVSLHQAVAGWQDTLFGNGGAAVRGEDRSFLTRSGGERSWSWTEYFVANFPTDPATAVLRAESARIRGAGYVGQATGPATCLLR